MSLSVKHTDADVKSPRVCRRMQPRADRALQQYRSSLRPEHVVFSDESRQVAHDWETPKWHYRFEFLIKLESILESSLSEISILPSQRHLKKREQWPSEDPQ